MPPPPPNRVAAGATPPQPRGAGQAWQPALGSWVREACAGSVHRPPSVLSSPPHRAWRCAPASGSPAGSSECPRPGLPPVAGLPRATHRQRKDQAALKKLPLGGTVAPEMPTASCVRGLSLRPLQIKKHPGRPRSCPSAASGVARPGVLALGLGGGGCLLFGGCFPGLRART